jgi:peptidoglycan biosynthesis protein MviN/MurJ (putative lipid II flippase)
MSTFIAQVATPSEGLESGLYQPLYLVLVIYVVLFVLGRVLEGRDDPRTDTVLDAGFALLCLAAVYVAVLAVYAFTSEFDLIADMVEIMAVMIGFFAILVVVLLGIELLLGLRGRRRRQGVEVPPPSSDKD